MTLSAALRWRLSNMVLDRNRFADLRALDCCRIQKRVVLPSSLSCCCVRRTTNGRVVHRGGGKALSKREKNELMKELKRKAKQGTNSLSGPLAAPPSWHRLHRRFMPQPPRLPGGSYGHVKREHVLAAGKRLPIYVLLLLLACSDKTSPLVLDTTKGPSMLPTIYPLGDIYLRLTGAWYRAVGMDMPYQKGDVIAFRTPSGGGRGYSCKRIVAVEGDKVRPYGQFSHLYRDRADLGIVTSKRTANYNVSWDENMTTETNYEADESTVVVPPGHVWVEGDSPLFSIDSRHYGPVPLQNVRGRLLCRIWPLWRTHGRPWLLARERPVPFTTKQEALVGDYNLQGVDYGDATKRSGQL